VTWVKGLLLGGWLAAVPGMASATSQGQKTDARHSASLGFRPAVYQGIRMGTSRKEEVLARFGKPQGEGPGEDGSLYLIYRDIGIVRGRAQFVVNPRTNVVIGLDVGPTTATLPELERILGTNHVPTRWSWAMCTEKAGMTQVYIDPQGPLSEIEYRHLGISIQMRGDLVDSIYYSSKPIGLDANPCTKPAKRQTPLPARGK